MTLTMTTTSLLLDDLLNRSRASGIFGECAIADGMLQCAAKESAAPAWYRIEQDGGAWFVSLVTPDRWLSESIEADLMHYGDPMEELIEEEMIELGYQGEPLKVQHYRSDDMLYTFRSRLPLTGDAVRDARTAELCLLGYEAAFRELGDMVADDEE